MHLTTLRAVGGSVMFAIPKAILEGLGLSPNSRVGVSVTDGRLIVEPHPRARYTLSELLALCDPSIPGSDEDQQWLNEPPTGNELL
jgi:antitoxin ChpS